MTESMFTIRLSSVMTPCGGKGTTCSRMSRLYCTRSMMGMTRWGPGVSRRLNFPSRSTKPIFCWWMILMLEARKATSNAMITRTTMNWGMETPARDLGPCRSQPGTVYIIPDQGQISRSRTEALENWIYDEGRPVHFEDLDLLA